jgi:hypothetical protein
MEGHAGTHQLTLHRCGGLRCKTDGALSNEQLTAGGPLVEEGE